MTPAPSPPHGRAFALLTLVMLFWAGNAIVGRAVRFDIPPFTLAFGRWAIAFAFVLPFALGPLRRDAAALLRGWKALLVLGVLGVGAFNAMLYTGLTMTTASNALLIGAANPPVVALFDRLLFGVRVGLVQGLGMAASVLGVIGIVFEGDPGTALALQFAPGDLLILASVVVWALYTVLLRTRPKVAQVSFIAVTFAVGVATMVPFALWEWRSGLTVDWSWEVGAAFLYVGLLPSLVAYFIYNWATGVVGPARAGQAITLMPLFGAALSAVLLGERLHPYHFGGMALIVLGVGLSAWSLRAGGAAAARSLEQRE